MSSSPDNGPVLKEGEKLGHYEIRELVGEGPLGRVYKARDTQFDVIAALKVLHPALAADRAVRTETVNVFRSLIEFESEGFVKVFDAEIVGERLVVATDYLEGLMLRRLLALRGGKFTWEEAEPIIDAVCLALETMRPGEVHGDLKPENIFILPDAVKLTDLGLSRIMAPAQFVATQVEAGNAYLAPELAEDAERITHDPAVDVYAVGALMYQLLTGALPSEGNTRPGKKVPTLPGKIDEIVTRALAPNPDDRYPHVAELHLELMHLANKDETAAKVEIFLQDLPERPLYRKPPPPPPPPPAAPQAPAGKSKSLFDESMFSAAEDESKSKAKVPPGPPPAPRSKTPLIAGAVGAVVVALGVIGFLATRPQEPPAPPAEKAAAPKPAPTVAKVDDAVKRKAEDALARAEEARDDAIRVDASKSAPDAFVAAMQTLRNASDAARGAKYAAAVTLAESAEQGFQDTIIKGVAAQGKKAEKPAPPAVAAEPAPVKPEAVAKKPPCPADMVQISAGGFIMGAPSNDPDRNPGEKYNESVSVAGYCIDKYEFPNKKGALPQLGVSWPQAKAACESKGKRLCRETEWEKACKGPSNQKYPYGPSFDANKCNTEDAKGNDRKVAPSGTFNHCASGYGVYDMSGNLWEWTDSLLQSNLKDRVMRGGSFTRPDYHDRCANRYNSLPSVADNEFGFRCCMDVNP